MHILTSFLRWLLRAVCLAAVVGTVYVATISTTLLDRHDVKQWLSASKLYDDNALITALFSQQPVATGSTDMLATEQSIVSNESIKNAMARAFPASFLKTSFENVIDQSYDWIEGKSATFSFSVPINDRREVFIAELVKEVEPRVAALPLCSPSVQAICRPNVPISDFARQLVTDSIAQSDFLTTPLTQSAFSSATSSQEMATLSELPQLRSTVLTLLWVLPLIFCVALLITWWLTPGGQKLALFIKISRGVFSSMILAVVLAGAVILIEQLTGFQLESVLPGVGPLGPIMAQFITQMILGLSWALLFFAGIALVISIASWVLFSQLKKRSIQPLSPAHAVLAVPASPSSPIDPPRPSL